LNIDVALLGQCFGNSKGMSGETLLDDGRLLASDVGGQATLAAAAGWPASHHNEGGDG
jgi:hypothetical protein